VLIFTATYFIGFNIYYPYMLPFLQQTLGLSESLSGILLGVGLLAASLFAIPAARVIDRGHLTIICVLAILASVVGLLAVWLAGSNLVWLSIGILFVGIGYIAVIQTTMAWTKNLCPINSRGQFEGIRIVAFVLVPMVFGPTIGTWFIGDQLPQSFLFGVSIPFTLLSVVPLYFLNKKHLHNLAIR